LKKFFASFRVRGLSSSKLVNILVCIFKRLRRISKKFETLPSSPILTTFVVVFLRFLEVETGVVCDDGSSLSIVITCGEVCRGEVCRDIGLDVGLDVVLDVVLGLRFDVVAVEVAAAGEVAAGEVAAGEVAAGEVAAAEVVAAEVEASPFFVLANFDRPEKIPVIVSLFFF
jgi:hypothetical protein